MTDPAPSRGRGLRRSLPAGVVDSALASMATFGIGLVAVNLFNDTDRGVYAIFFNAFMVGMTIPWYLVFLPLEARAIELPLPHRLGIFRASLGPGSFISALSALVAGVAFAATWGRTANQVVIALAATTALTIVLSPIQDHVRRSFHLADASWKAAATSGVQFVTAATFLLLGYFVFGVPTEWLPFGSLVIANTLSLAVASRLVPSDVPGMARPRLRDVGSQGSYLLFGAVAPRVSQLLGAIVMAYLIGEAEVGFAEAARVAAQPILVLAFGIGAVVSPRSMSAASSGTAAEAQRLRRMTAAIMVPTGLLYLAITAVDWSLNPIARLVPAAYTIGGLVAFTAVSNILLSLELPYRAEMIGARLERDYAFLTIGFSALAVGVAATSPVTRAFARPLGELGRAVGQIWTYGRTLAASRRPTTGPPSHSPPPG